MGADSLVTTVRLELIPWTVELIDGFLTGKLSQAEGALDVTFPEPFGPPPETGDVLDYFRAAVDSNRSDGSYVPRMIVRRNDRMAVGSFGLGSPNEAGVSILGYGVYPRFEGQGYSSESAAALVEWGLTQPDITAIRATIPIAHVASEIVSGRAGLELTGEQIDDEKEGMLNVWERRNES